jgi:hypothetical protein
MPTRAASRLKSWSLGSERQKVVLVRLAVYGLLAVTAVLFWLGDSVPLDPAHKFNNGADVGYARFAGGAILLAGIIAMAMTYLAHPPRIRAD